MDPCNSWAPLAGFIRDVGFPIAVAVYLLARFDPLIRRMNNTMHGVLRALTGLGFDVRGPRSKDDG